MSLYDISSTNLGKILNFMKTDPRNVDSLRKTCKVFNKQAVELGLHKVNGAFIRLAIEPRNFRYQTHRMRKDCVIKATIKIRKPTKDPDCPACYHHKKVLRRSYYKQYNSDSDGPIQPYREVYEDATDSEGSGQEDTYKIGSDRRFIRYPNVADLSSGSESEGESEDEREPEDLICSCKTWFVIAVKWWPISRRKKFTEIFSRILKRVNSIDKLKIKCYRINDNEMKFMNQQPQLSNLRKLVLFNCHLHVEKDSFYGFLRSPYLAEVMLSCKYTNYRLEDKFLHNMNRIRIVGVFGKKQRLLAGLTNNLLNIWRDRPPTHCTMRGFDTKFTIDGIIRLMRAIQKSRWKCTYVLSMLPMDGDEYRTLFKFIQGRKTIKWSFIKKGLYGIRLATQSSEYAPIPLELDDPVQAIEAFNNWTCVTTNKEVVVYGTEAIGKPSEEVRLNL